MSLNQEQLKQLVLLIAEWIISPVEGSEHEHIKAKIKAIYNTTMPNYPMCVICKKSPAKASFKTQFALVQFKIDNNIEFGGETHMTVKEIELYQGTLGECRDWWFDRSGLAHGKLYVEYGS